MRAATVVQGSGHCRRLILAVDGHDLWQGCRATAGGTGQLAGVTPGVGSHRNAQLQNLWYGVYGTLLNVPLYLFA